jgi:hypothetical protein
METTASSHSPPNASPALQACSKPSCGKIFDRNDEMAGYTLDGKPVCQKCGRAETEAVLPERLRGKR